METTSESEKEADIKKTKVPLRLTGRKSTDNHFLRILQDPGHVSLHETDRIADNSLKNRSKKYSLEKLQEKKEDSEDSMLNIPSKPRVQLLRKRKANDVFQKKLVDEVNSSDNPHTGSKHLRKSHIDDLNLSRASPKTQYPNIKKSFIHNRESSEHDRIPLGKKSTLKTRILQTTQEENAFEAAFADNSDAGLPKGRDLTLKIDAPYSTRDVEPQAPKISSLLSPEIPIAGSTNDIHNQLEITGPRSQIFKALNRSSKETRDKILQDIANSSSVSHNIFDERSIILKPKTRINRVFNTSPTGNPFEEVFQEHSDNSGKNVSSMSTRHFASSELDVAMGTISPVAFSPARNLQSSMNKRLKKLSSLSKSIPRRRSSSLDEEQGENVSNELYKHLEEQHTEVPNAVNVLRSRDNRTVLIEKVSASKVMPVEKIAQLSKDNVPASKTSVGVMDIHKSGLFETDDSSEAVINTKYRLHGQDARKTAKLTRSNSRSKSATPKIVSDITKKLLRRSTRLNKTIEYFDNSILESEVETHSSPQTRKSTRNSKNISVSERESTVISRKSRRLEDVATDKMKDATTFLQTNQQKSPSQSDRTGDKTFRRTSTRISTLQDGSKSNVKDNKNTSRRQSGLIQSHSDSNSSIRASTKDISKDKVSANKTHAVVRMDTDESLFEILTDDLPAVTTEKSGYSTSIIHVSEQDVHKKSRLSRNISTSKIASDLRVESLRRSERLNSSIEHSDNQILNSETRNTSQMKGNISKTNTRNRTIGDFFRVKPGSLSSKKHSTSNDPHSVPLEIFKDAKKMQQFKEQVETMKSREITAMRMHANKTDKKQSVPKVKAAVVNIRGAMKKKLFAAPVKKMNPAYLVNGKVYKAPKLLRPKQWATNRLYKFLWKHIEPKYKLATRVRSEKFVEELSKTVTMILRRKKYNNYKNELEALMKEMARLQLINTRNDFYNFCRDFMPYEFRVKVIPILLPGNQQTIPYEPEKLHTPLLDE